MSSHLQNFTQCICISSQQYFYIYFPELASLQTLKTLISHLQHFTQCICIPHSSTRTYTFLNWQAFKHLNIITLTTFYPVYTHSPQQYSYIYFPKLASLQTLKCHHTYNILPSVYMHSPQQYSYIYFPELANLQNT